MLDFNTCDVYSTAIYLPTLKQILNIITQDKLESNDDLVYTNDLLLTIRDGQKEHEFSIVSYV